MGTGRRGGRRRHRGRRRNPGKWLPAGVVACSMVGVPVALAGCSPSSGRPAPPPTVAPAVLTGTVYPCVGAPAPTRAEYEKLQVFVTVSRGGRPVAHQSGHGTMTYRFTVPPGSYVLTGQLDTPARTVTVGSHDTAETDLTADCS